jgi:hypothetical protein
MPDKDEVPGSSPGRPTTHRRRSQRCRHPAGSARCRLGPRWGRTPIPAGASSGPCGSAHPGVRLGDDHPPWSRPQPRTAARGMRPPRAAACTRAQRAAARDGRSARRSGLPGRSAGRRGRRGPHPTRRPGSATDLPLTNATSAASPASRLVDRRSSRRRPGSHRGRHRFRWSRSPGQLDLVPPPPPEHGRRRTRPDGGRHQTVGQRTVGQRTGGQRTGGQQTADRRTRWTTTPGDRTPDGWTAGSRTPKPDGGHRLLDTGDRRRGVPAGGVDHATTPELSIPAGRSSGQTPSGRATTRTAQQQGRRGHPRWDGWVWPPPRQSAASGTPLSSWRLGALLSSDDYGQSVERAALGQVLWRVAMRVPRALSCSGLGRDGT